MTWLVEEDEAEEAHEELVTTRSADDTSQPSKLAESEVSEEAPEDEEVEDKTRVISR